MIHAGIFHHLMANFPAVVPIGFPFAPPIHSSPPPSPPSCQSSWAQRTHNSKASAFSIDAILGRPVQQQNSINIIQSQQQHNQQQYQQHLQKKAVEHQHQQNQQQQLHHQHHPYHRISRPAPYPSSVSSGSANDISSAGNNIIVSSSNTNNNNSSSVRNNSNGGSGGKAPKSKRIRTIFTAEQLERLEAEFARQQYMVGPERVYLAATLQLSEAQVKVWFQNRRIKWRKQYMESQHARFQDHPLSDSPTDRAESRSSTSPLADVDAVSTHDTSDDDRALRQSSVERHTSVDVGSSSPTQRASSLSPPPPSGHASRSPSPCSSSESSSSPPSSPGAGDNHTLSHCDVISKTVDSHNTLNISYSHSVPPTLSHYLSVSQLNSSMMAVKDQLAKAQRSLH